MIQQLPLLLPVSVKKKLLRKRGPLGKLARKTPDQGLESSFCRWVASTWLLLYKRIFVFTDTGTTAATATAVPTATATATATADATTSDTRRESLLYIIISSSVTTNAVLTI